MGGTAGGDMVTVTVGHVVRFTGAGVAAVGGIIAGILVVGAGIAVGKAAVGVGTVAGAVAAGSPILRG